MEIELTLRIRVDSQDEADKIQEAAFNGLAAALVRIGVLYGQVPFGGVAPLDATPRTDSAERRAERQRAAEIELKRVETKVAHAVEQVEEETAPKRPSGLAGRKRIGRS